MQKQTVSRWKRDSLEAYWDYRGQEDDKSKLIRKLANQVALLTDEVLSLKVFLTPDVLDAYERRVRR